MTRMSASLHPAHDSSPRLLRSIAALRRSNRITPSLLLGAAIMLIVALFSLIGPFFIDQKLLEVGVAIPNLAPSAAHWLGTDAQGRDMFAITVVGTPQTLKIGLVAGAVGIGIGLILGLLAGYFGGPLDTVIRTITDSLMTVPALAILIVIASNVQEMTVGLMGVTVAALAWMVPTRLIRAQVVSIRERAYINVARANGAGELEVLLREVMPNLMPYIAASFVAAVSGAILVAVGLEALGLGASTTHTLGTTIYWADQFAAVLRGEWWWWSPPIVVIAVIFMGLYLLSVGLDRICNPRLGPRS
jgi:peptide/nickel transport system permease protein